MSQPRKTPVLAAPLSTAPMRVEAVAVPTATTTCLVA